MSNVIETHNLTKYYGSKCVVNSMDLCVPEGCVYGLLGRNGAGKSTLIKMLLGLVQPNYGRATVLGEEPNELRPETRSRIAYLAEGHPLYRWMKIREAVALTRSFYPGFNDTLLGQILDHFELSPQTKIRRLSNGQRAQVSLALAVAQEPELLILDDPTIGLDTVVRRDFLESLIQIIQRKGRTILFSSHILGDVERVADRIGIIEKGVLRVDCPTEHFKEAVKKILLDFPGAPPECPACEGVISNRQVGNQLELVVVGYNGRQKELVESLSARSVEVVDLNLEDAFIEYTRGPRRRLPIFAEGETNVEQTGS
jgi:ABC-2 type transport system ATP-binding protein